jgi:hypothetical protein
VELGADLEKDLGLDEGSVEAAGKFAGGKSAGGKSASGTGPGAAAARRASR